MAANKFLRNDGQFEPVDSASVVPTTAATGTGFLGTITATMASSTQIATAATTLASVSQGSSGVWLAFASASFVSSAAPVTLCMSITDGTNIYNSSVTSLSASTLGGATIISIATSPAGNLRLTSTVTSGVVTALTSNAGVNDPTLTYINVIRIG